MYITTTLEDMSILRIFMFIHEAETEWINGKFPLSIEQVRNLLIEEPCEFPPDFDINNYCLFEATPSRVLKDIDNVFTNLHERDLLRHGSGTFTYNNFAK